MDNSTTSTESSVGHVLIIPDGHRRYAKKMGRDLIAVCEIGGRLLAKLIIVLVSSPLTSEVSVYPLAGYNLARSIAEVAGLAAGADQFFHALLKQQDPPIRYFHIGNKRFVESLSVSAGTMMDQLTNHAGSGMGKRVNLLLGYESLASAPSSIDARDWRPFENDINLIYRFGQPRGMVRGSAIFPMSDQAYWTGTTTLFPEANITIAARLIQRRLRLALPS